jgi:2-polyprenyl-3-methyl-5-hydroxy-6-metoxy-1,4-benzoquinol methylase
VQSKGGIKSSEKTNPRELRANHAKNILKKNGVLQYGNLLDIGCGTGAIADFFHKEGAKVIGIDPNSKMIEEAKKYKSCIFLVQNGTNLQFTNSSFDTIIINDVLEHVPYNQARKLLEEAKRVMNVNGRMYVSIMNRWQIQEPHCRIPFLTWLPKFTWNITYSILKRTRKRYTDYYFPYTKQSFLNLAGEAGLKSTDYTGDYGREKINHPEQIGSKSIRLIVKILTKMGLQPQISDLSERFSVLIFVCTN